MIVLVIGIAIAGGLLFALGAVALGTVLHGAAATAAGILGGAALVLFLYGVMIFLAVRMTFFIPPVVVAERKIDLARVWQLTHGNFWRIFIIGLALVIPLGLIVLAAVVALYGPTLFHVFDIFTLITHRAPQPVIQHQMEAWSVAIRVKGLTLWPVWSVFQLIFGTFSYGLLYSASAFAYREIQPTSGMRD
jgi:hypothetical protein